MRAWFRASLRRRLMALVIFGAILPMAVVGWWLTQSAVRSAEDRLRAELDSTLAGIGDGIERRWETRRGDLLLIAGNEVVARTAAANARVTAADSTYMQQLFESIHLSIPAFQVRASDGSTRWTFTEPSDARPDSIGRNVPSPRPDDSFIVRLPVGRAPARESAGLVEAYVRLNSVLPTDIGQRVVGSAVLSVVDRLGGRVIAASPFPPRTGFISARRALASPPLDLSLGAPATAFVRPFQHAARVGLVALGLVAAVVLALSVYLTTRLTSSLTHLQDAATAVSRGDLERRVPRRGHDEVARVADAFNAMTDNLQRTLRDLSQQQALAAVGEYAATLSHEVRNALSSVRVDLQRAEERAEDPVKIRALLSRALNNLQRLDGIVSGSLSVARQGRRSFERIDLRDVLDASVAATEPAFARSGGTIVWRRGTEELPVDGDAGALQQVFTNVLINAGQSLSRGGTTVIESAIDDGACRVTARDTGIGIEPERLAQVGEPFHSSKSEGTGIGLAIARRILDAHGGALTMESELGVGTVVHIKIPSSARRASRIESRN